MISEIVVKTRKRLVPLIITMFIAIGFSIVGLISGFFDFNATFIPENQGNLNPLIGLINAMILIIIASFGGFIIYLLLKYKKEKFLKHFFFISFVLISGLMLFLFGLSILYIFSISDLLSFFIVIIVSFLSGVALTLAIFHDKFSKNVKIKNAGLLIYGGLIGSFLGLILPNWTSFLLLIGLAIYDIIAVFKGPIKKIIELNEKKNSFAFEMSYSMQDYEIGLGDLTFYSMLTCSALKIGFETPFISQYGIIAIFLPCIASIIGILIGAIITFKLLEKREILPGLPLSIGIGIGFFGIVFLIFWLL
ncbi:MAG: hypothetical protein ACTSQO_06165 [Candidatus Helarchaeota archaeon]